MPGQHPYVDHCLGLLAPLGPVMPRRMFGGWGFYLDGVMFALIADDQLYLKVDAETLDRFAAAGGEPFVYEGKTKPVTMSYWRPPEAAMAAPKTLLPWAELAVAAAGRAAARKPKRRKAGSRHRHKAAPRADS